MGRRGRSTVIAGAVLADLKFSQLVLEIRNVSPAIFDVAVDTCLDGGIGGGLSHVSCGIDKGLFSFDLAKDLGDGLVGVGHGGGDGG